MSNQNGPGVLWWLVLLGISVVCTAGLTVAVMRLHGDTQPSADIEQLRNEIATLRADLQAAPDKVTARLDAMQTKLETAANTVEKTDTEMAKLHKKLEGIPADVTEEMIRRFGKPSKGASESTQAAPTIARTKPGFEICYAPNQLAVIVQVEPKTRDVYEVATGKKTTADGLTTVLLLKATREATARYTAPAIQDALHAIQKDFGIGSINSVGLRNDNMVLAIATDSKVSLWNINPVQAQIGLPLTPNTARDEGECFVPITTETTLVAPDTVVPVQERKPAQAPGPPKGTIKPANKGEQPVAGCVALAFDAKGSQLAGIVNAKVIVWDTNTLKVVHQFDIQTK
jgi:hypothetical protein